MLSLFFSSPVLLEKKEICVYQVSTTILRKLLAAADYCFIFNLISLRRVKNSSWSSSHFEDMEKKKVVALP